ncbi:MAG: BMP family ABC transporter substrate-binding protein, partial [Oscillospiraceae bacterium]|nr:BMP family ABC transporter substrate-binding protein [Oscillospiraceae bacterium]
MKKFLTLLLILALSLSLVACGGGETGGETEGEASNADIRVCFVVGALGDNSFADSCDRGLKEAEADFGITYDAKQVGDDGALNGVREAAQNGYDIVVSGYGAEICAMLEAEAKDYPDTTFFLYNATDTTWVAPENVLAVVFSANESDFVAGAVAAKMSTTKVTGWIGGQENTDLYNFMVGWVEGVKYADDSAATAYSWVAGSSPWSDPAKAKELTKALYNNYGADIMHGVAGQSGDGVIEAVLELREETGNDALWDIGVDSDQYAIFMANEKEDKAEVILTSSLKPCALPAYNLVKAMVEGTEMELGTQVYGIAEGGAGIAENDFFAANASDEAKAIVTQITEDVLAGKVEVTSAFGLSLEDLNAILAATTVNFTAVSA